jgi:hypothetical protein
VAGGVLELRDFGLDLLNLVSNTPDLHLMLLLALHQQLFHLVDLRKGKPVSHLKLYCIYEPSTP